eukprot:1138244-Pelagomonas_calceolata.AAC.3
MKYVLRASMGEIKRSFFIYHCRVRTQGNIGSSRESLELRQCMPSFPWWAARVAGEYQGLPCGGKSDWHQLTNY